MPYYEDRWTRDGRLFAVVTTSNATAATADHVGFGLWNPSGTRSIWLLELAVTHDGSSGTIPQRALVRTSARGTPGTTVTPDLDNDFEREITPASGFVLDRAFSVQPTVTTPPILRFNWPGASASLQASSNEWLFPGEGIRVPPGTGLAMITVTAVAMPSMVITVVVGE